MIPVYIGASKIIGSDRIIAVIDYNYFSEGSNREFYAACAEKGKIEDYTDGNEPRSLIITEDKIYLSGSMPGTLKNKIIRNIK